MAGSINACDGGAAERARERQRAEDREEERVRKEERDAERSAKAHELQQQIENGASKYPPRRPAASEDELKRMIDELNRRQLEEVTSATASATATPAPRCNCKPSDPLCDCL